MQSIAAKYPPICVVIPAYNRAHCIGNAIETVLKQTHPSVHIIVVDDGSADRTADAVLALKENDPRILFIRHTSNRGVSAARNTGINCALAMGFDYIALLDSDDTWDPEKLAKQMALLRSLPGSEQRKAAIFCDFETCVMGENRSLPNRMSQHPDQIAGFVANEIWPGNSSTLLAHRDVYLAVGNFDTRLSLGEDYEWILRYLMQGGKFHIVPEMLMQYNWDPNKKYSKRYDCWELMHKMHTRKIGETLGKPIRRSFERRVRLLMAERAFREKRFARAAGETCHAIIHQPKAATVEVTRFMVKKLARRIKKAGVRLQAIGTSLAHLHR